MAVKLALEDPDATDTLPGTVKVPTLLETDTDTPVPAALVKVTVQLEVPPVVRLVGLHETPLT